MNVLKISVSGIRGTFPSPLTPALAFRYARAYGLCVKPEAAFLATDTRPSGHLLASAVAAGLTAAGVPVRMLGVAPTPSAQFAVEKTPCTGGIVVTASHNPLPSNGLKFLSSSGSFLTGRQWENLLQIAGQCTGQAGARMTVPPRPDAGMVRAHLEAVVSSIDAEAVRKRRFVVVVDPVQGTGAIWTRLFLKRLGCRIHMVNSRPIGRFSRNPEPLPHHLGALCTAVRRFGADIGFAQDPDADRLACVTETGTPAGEEFTLVLAAESALARGRTPVVVNLSTSALMEIVARRWNVPIYRAPVGEANVAEKMRKVGAGFGGEGNGGVIWSRVHTGRDSFVGMALILDFLAKENVPLSAILSRYPAYVIMKEKWEVAPEQVPVVMARAKRHYRRHPVDLTDGVRVVLDDGWIHIRPSGTEPVIRLIVEGTSRTAAERLRALARSACGLA